MPAQFTSAFRPMFTYTVRCTFETEAVAHEWIAWLRNGHLADVLAAGAVDAEVVRPDGAAIQAEVRYHFASREAFVVYERDHAPRLRAEGLKRFPPERGLIYERFTGESLFTLR